MNAPHQIPAEWSAKRRRPRKVWIEWTYGPLSKLYVVGAAVLVVTAIITFLAGTPPATPEQKRNWWDRNIAPMTGRTWADIQPVPEPERVTPTPERPIEIYPVTPKK